MAEDVNGDLELVLGGSGGSRILPAVFQVLLNVDWGYDISAAIEDGRVHNQLFPQFVDADSTIDDDLLSALRYRGHNVTGALQLRIRWSLSHVDFQSCPLTASRL